MPDKKDIPVAMEAVHRRLQRWRKTRRGRSPIPIRLWAAAARLARKHGVSATAQALGLEFNKLRSFVEAEGAADKEVTGAPRFLELVATDARVTECVIELEGRRGKMRIEWKGPGAPDLAGLGRMLWEQG